MLVTTVLRDENIPVFGWVLFRPGEGKFGIVSDKDLALVFATLNKEFVKECGIEIYGDTYSKRTGQLIPTTKHLVLELMEIR